MKVIAVVVDSWRGLFLLPMTPGKLEKVYFQTSHLVLLPEQSSPSLMSR
jgi:hypothetical protein